MALDFVGDGKCHLGSMRRILTRVEPGECHDATTRLGDQRRRRASVRADNPPHVRLRERREPMEPVVQALRRQRLQEPEQDRDIAFLGLSYAHG